MSAHPKSGQSTMPAANGLVIGIWVSLGLTVAFAIVWVCYWKRSAGAAGRAWWVWLGALITAACVNLSLWGVYFLGSGALSWIVPTLATIVIPLCILVYQQTAKAPAPAQGASAETENENTVNEVPAGAVALIPGDLHEHADIDREALAEAFEVLAILKLGVGDLRRGIESALTAYRPGEDWRILLGMPRQKLDGCLNLLEQLNGVPRRWVHTGKWSFAFSDKLDDINRTSAELRAGLTELAAGKSPSVNIQSTATRLEDLVGELDSLMKSAAIPP
jgi:hypothetical protein